MAGEVSAEAVLAVLKAFYVDDLLASYPTVEKAAQIREELQKMLEKGGFELCKWKSTHRGVLDPKDEQEGVRPSETKEVDGSAGEEPMDKVVGIN